MSSRESEPLLVGIDTGGTFTDFIVAQGRELRAHKVLSIPSAPDQAILQGLEELGIRERRLNIRHGSTVATNTVLEEDGARVAFVTNRGLGDVLTLGRQQRPELYRLSTPPIAPPVPARLCFEVDGRIGADGQRVTELSEASIEALCDALGKARPDAVAVSLLFSFLDRSDEDRIAAALGRRWPVSLSADVLPEIGEYERGIATWLNAYVAPRMGRYLARLGDALDKARISVMQSDGLTAGARRAADHGVRLLLSGPAGGLVGAQLAGQASGHSRLLTLDVGGTSTDVALIDRDVQIRRDGRVGRFPVAVPMVDLHTVGAGGGSIATLDAQGLLHVGPRSAGADPGPAAYGRGGTEPTVTDAFVVAGRLPDGAALGQGDVRLQQHAARGALAPLASRLDRSVDATAQAVIRVANEQMAAALRVISIERGHDPRRFVLVAFGGAGGLHVCELAELLGIRRAMVPLHAGVLSALGMAAAAPGREVTRAWPARLADLTVARVEQAFGTLHDELSDALAQEGTEVADGARMLDLRYLGQSFTLTLPWEGDATADAFHHAHQERFGHRLDHPVELVNLRLRLWGETPELQPRVPQVAGELPAEGPISLQSLPVGRRIAGPRTILDATGACWVAPGWVAEREATGNLLLSVAGNSV